MNELALFAGAGGGILGGILNGWRTVCAVEINDYCRRVLMQRQDDGCLEPFPIWDDITTFDGRPWAGCVDIVTGGFPCQDISAAGRGAGISGERSGLWSEMARIIGEVRPRYVLVENSPMLTIRGLGTVLGDLAALGFDAEWGCLSAAATGAPHKRDRMWIVAKSGSEGAWSLGRETDPDRWRDTGRHEPAFRQAHRSHGSDWVSPADCAPNHVADADREPRQESERQSAEKCGRHDEARLFAGIAGSSCMADGWESLANANSHSAQGMESESQPRRHGRPAGLHGGAAIFPAWPVDPADAPESGVGRVVDGVAKRVDRLKALGNGQVPRVVSAAWEALNV